MPVRGSAAPAPKIATVRAPRGGRLRETQGASLGAWPAASRAGPRVSEDPYDSRRSATPSRGLREAKKQNPGAKRAAGTRSAVSNGETYWVVTACAIKMSLPGLTRQSILFAKTFPEEDGPAGQARG